MADDISWVAGLLEGEGCFSLRSKKHNPIIQICMTDADVLIRAAKIIGSHKVIEVKKDTRGGKKLYRTTLYGSQAIFIMKLIYDQMGIRRKAQIDMCIDDFECKKNHVRKYKERTPYSRGAIIIWQKQENPIMQYG